MSGITCARAECIEFGCQMIEGAPYHKMLEVARAEVSESRAEIASLKARAAKAEEAKDTAYSERNALVAFIASMYPSCLARHVGDPWEDDWRWIVFIDLPTGQVSWHIHDSELPQFDRLPRDRHAEWDGHTTEEKYARLAKARAALEAK